MSIRAVVLAIACCGLGIGLLVTGARARSDFGPRSPLPDSAAIDYGITLAFKGDTTGAELAFISVLSRSKGDARALNNLGNLRFRVGDVDMARAYYQLASESDSLDPGIALNRAVASWYLGDEEQASRDRDQGFRLAGGEEGVLALLDMPQRDAVGTLITRTRTGIRINEVELRQFLLQAAKQVPPPTPGDTTARIKSSPSRKAGVRAGMGSDVMEVLYWKR